MRAQPPAFWQDPDSALGHVLSPLGRMYGGVVARRLRGARALTLPVPVVCTGNVTMGGVGKTPWTMMLAERLRARGLVPHVLIRGYGGTARGPLSAAGQSASAIGDEAVLHAERGPTWVGADRTETGRAAHRAGATALLMDDGFQNPGLAKDLSFLLVDAEAPFGNGHVFPAGPCRERPVAAAARADALVSIGARGHAPPPTVMALAGGKPVLTGWMTLDTDGLPTDKPLYAIAGIGRPARFFGALRASGFDVRQSRAFPDHHQFTAPQLGLLIEEADAAGAHLVTTRKDHVRLPPDYKERFIAVPAHMTTDDEPLDALLSRVCP